jgi:hypothetical protein
LFVDLIILAAVSPSTKHKKKKKKKIKVSISLEIPARKKRGLLTDRHTDVHKDNVILHITHG